VYGLVLLAQPVVPADPAPHISDTGSKPIAKFELNAPTSAKQAEALDPDR